MVNTGSLRTAAFAFLSSALLYYAPAAGTDVLATVDGEPVVTLEDVSHYLGAAQLPAGAEITAGDVEDLVETLVDADVLLREALARGFAEDEGFKNDIARFVSWTLREMKGGMLLEEESVSEEAVRDYYEKGTKWRRVSRILAKNRDLAEAAHRELENGRPWDEVAEEYSIIRTDAERTGSYPVPLVYDGRAATAAAYETPVGEYTPAVPDNDGIRWVIYRIDKIIHGTGEPYEKERTAARASLENAVLAERYAAFLEKARGEIPIARNEDLWRDLQTIPFEEFHIKWGSPEAVASDVGGVAVTGKDLVAIILDYFGLGADGLDERRDTDPEDFAYVTEALLSKIEGGALLEAAARRDGMDRSPAFTREYETYREGALIRKLIAAEFDTSLPQPTVEQAEEYYENHLDEFRVAEKIELYVVAMPDREKLLGFHERIVAGGDLVLEGEIHNQTEAKRFMDMYELPPESPPEEQEWMGVVQINREPNPAAPDKDFAAELRPRAFRYTDIKKPSEVFQLNDGRWAFYAPIFYQPSRQKTFDEVVDDCKRQVWKEYLGSDEIERLSREWIASLRTGHVVQIDSAAIEKAALHLNAAE
jgi:hypothetical protein